MTLQPKLYLSYRSNSCLNWKGRSLTVQIFNDIPGSLSPAPLQSYDWLFRGSGALWSQFSSPWPRFSAFNIIRTSDHTYICVLSQWWSLTAALCAPLTQITNIWLKQSRGLSPCADLRSDNATLRLPCAERTSAHGLNARNNHTIVRKMQSARLEGPYSSK